MIVTVEMGVVTKAAQLKGEGPALASLWMASEERDVGTYQL